MTPDNDLREHPPAAETAQTSGGLVLALLRIPLFYKILLANAVIVALVALAIVLAVDRFVGASVAEVTEAIALVAVLGVLLSLGVNAMIVRLALLPLERLEQTALHVRGGIEDARADPTRLADRRFARLVDTFNDMLDRIAAQRRRLREVNIRALAAAEEERKRIARELHDGTAQSLAALRVRLRLARSVDEPSVRTALIEEVSEEIGAAIEEVRRMARGLRPPALDMLGLAPAIESHARSVAEASGLRVELELEPVERMLAPEAELAVYRIIQEALSNVVRHAGAHTVRVALHTRDGSVRAVVEDDGAGFAPDRILANDSGRGLGLFGMQERASYVGGAVDIESRPQRGTRIVVAIPVAENQHVV